MTKVLPFPFHPKLTKRQRENFVMTKTKDGYIYAPKKSALSEKKSPAEQSESNVQ